MCACFHTERGDHVRVLQQHGLSAQQRSPGDRPRRRVSEIRPPLERECALRASVFTERDTAIATR